MLKNDNGSSIDIHTVLANLPIRNTPLNELHYYSIKDNKYDSYMGPFTNLQVRCEPGCNENNLLPKEFNTTDYLYNDISKIAHKHDHMYDTAEKQNTTDEEILQSKLEADREMINALNNLTVSTFSEKFQKWLAKGILFLKVKMGMKLGGKINPLSGKPMDPIYSNSMANFFIDLEIMNAQKAHKQNPIEYPESYVNEITQNAEKIKKILGGTMNTVDAMDTVDTIDNEDTMNTVDNLDPDIIALVDKSLNEYKKDVKEYDDYKAEEDRKAREVSFIERLIEIIEKPMKFITNYTFGQIPFLQDFMTYDKLKGLITDGNKSKWELREEANALDEAIKSVDTKIVELMKQGHLSYNSPELQKLYDASAPLRKQRREYKKLLGFGLPILKGIHHKLAQELHSPIVRKFTRRSVFLNALDEIWSADLVFMPIPDNGFKCILTVIDNFSKYAWAIPLKSKKNKDIIDAFKTIFESSNRKPKKLWTDKGTEFIGSDVKLFLLQNKVQQYSTEVVCPPP